MLTSSPSPALSGTIIVPGDKSISHRAVMLGGIAHGRTTITGLLEGEDVLCTVAALRALGATITKDGTEWRIDGVGLEGLQEPSSILDMGNSGTAARLLIGLLAGRPFTSFFVGDASLSKRPMARVTEPLRQCGAEFFSRHGQRLPLAVRGSAKPLPITYTLPVASAQVKSALLLAGLSASGTTIIIEPIPTRDHSERMLRHFGADLAVQDQTIMLKGPARLIGQSIAVPGDISSAAFPLVAALLVPGSRLMIKNVGLNPRRTGLLTTLLEMGAKLTITNRTMVAGDEVGDLTVAHGALQGITVPAARAPLMIDEYPVLAMAAAFASGTTRMCGLSELRVKESDRLALTAVGLTACGIKVTIDGDDLIVYGTGGSVPGGGQIATAMDHRIAMSFLVLGLAAQHPITIDEDSFIATSFPGFQPLMQGLGAVFS